MDSGLFDMFHQAADQTGFAVVDRIHVHFNRIVQETIQQYRRVVGYGHRFFHIAAQALFVGDDFHRPAAQNVRRPHHQRITQLLSRIDGLLDRACGRVGRLQQVQPLQQFLKTFPVFRQIDGIGRGTDNRRAGGFQRTRQFQRRLSAVLHDHALGFFQCDNFQHVFQRQRLEIQAVGSVEIGGNGLRVAVDHNGFVTVLAQGQGGMHTAIIELDPLPDPVRPASQDNDFFPLADLSLAFLLVGRIQIRGIGRELGGTGIDPLVHRSYVMFVAYVTYFRFLGIQQLGQTGVGKPLPF